jgi:hypothetical protein
MFILPIIIVGAKIWDGVGLNGVFGARVGAERDDSQNK